MSPADHPVDQPTDRPEERRADDGSGRDAARRRARLDDVFGDVLPGSTSDDRDDGADPRAGTDAWLKAQVPPHHGG